MQVVLVRHPAPAIGVGVCYGRLDLPLTAEAARAVPALARMIREHGGAAVWTSPARRCRLLAQAVAGELGVTPRVDARLRELDFGDWEGVRWDAVPRSELDRWAESAAVSAPPGGESGAALLTRVGAAWQAIRAAGEDCIVVSHGGPLRILTALAQGEAPDLLKPSQPLGSVVAITC